MFNLILLLSFFSLSRVVLFAFAVFLQQININIIDFIQMIGLGIINDLATVFYFLLPIAIFSFLIPKRLAETRFFKGFYYSLYFILITALCFLIVSEFTFWLEFSTRFNFIAVDYLVYTHEVIGNIRESYPVFIILPSIAVMSVLIYWKLFAKIKLHLSNALTWKYRLKRFIIYIFAVIFCFYIYHPKINDIDNDNYLSELNKNGLYNLFSAFRHNTIDYFQFYKSQDIKNSLESLYQYINQGRNNSNTLSRYIKAEGLPKNYNVFLITIESLSSSFLDQEYHGPLTKNINELIKQSAYFSNFYAVGTRTVKGLEALSVGIPSLPGQSIVRRKDNGNLFSIGSVLTKENYDIKFIYGGFGYFDNMNGFFSKNHFKIWDRSNIPEKEIGFANIWGISDEDLYIQAIKQADISYDNKQKFFSLVMTTSNHRPYTYPAGKINIPASREGGVKYTDYALGEFIKLAKTKPWFDNTIFIITADHCAGSAGKVALPPKKYHIPLLIYAPKIIKPQVITNISSQIDVAPTILGLLNISYESKFFGNDLFTKNYHNAFISTFQKLGYIENDKLIVLSPGKQVQTYKIAKDSELKEEKENNILIKRAIDYYQSAYYLYQNGDLKNETK
jgi:phosphoglycerol transferase MdoB-like AlkP superfamily enzyme